MLENHDKFIEDVIKKAAKKDNLKEKASQRRKKEEAVITSLMDVTDLSRTEILAIINKTRKEQLKQERSKNTKEYKYNNFKAGLKSLLFKVFILIIIGLAGWAGYALFIKYSPAIMQVLQKEQSKQKEQAIVAKKVVKPAFELKSSHVKKIVLDKKDVVDIELTDFNLDGYLEILAIYDFSDQLDIYEMKDQIVSNKSSVDLQFSVLSDIGVIDFDSDGDQDIYITSMHHNHVQIYNNQDNQFTLKTLNQPYAPRSIKLLDSKLNGPLSLMSNVDFNLEYIRHVDKTQGVKKTNVVVSRNRYIPFDVGDLDKDGDNDVASIITNIWGEKILKISENLADIEISQYKIEQVLDYANNIDHMNIVLADKDDDGYLDITIFDKFEDEIMTLFCTGLTCGEPRIFSTKLNGVSHVVIADLDNDGDNDLLASSHDTNELVAFINKGNGVQARLVIDKYVEGIKQLKVGDINNNGYKNIVAGTTNGLIVYDLSGVDKK